MDIDIDSSYSLQKTCRICLVEKCDLKRITEPIIIMTKKLCDVQISLNDCLPVVICESCEGEIEKCYRFQKQIINNDLVLKKMLKVRMKIESDDNTELNSGDGMNVKLDKSENIQNYALESSKDVNKLTPELLINDIEIEQISDSDLEDNNLNEKQSENEVPSKKHENVDSNHTCSICNESFEEKQDLKLHLEMHVINDDYDQYSCPICSKAFVNDEKLQIHIETHTTNKRRVFECKICKKTYHAHSSYNYHIKLHTGRRYLCECKASFSSKQARDDHVRRQHTKEKRYSCPECGLKFFSSNQLCYHRQSHDKSGMLKCMVCSKQFKYKGKLKLHLMTHTDEKPIHCQFCRHRCRTKSDLTKHMRVHTREKGVFVCSYCGKKCSSTWNLQQHTSSHTKYSCSV